MNVLAFDTCLGALSVALQHRADDQQWVITEAYEARTTGHAERLFPMISDVLVETGMTLMGIDRIAVTVGPGTFTGVRVGIAAARGFAIATRKPVVTMTSLAVMAHHAAAVIGDQRGGRPLAVVVDARRGMVYAQLFTSDMADHGPALLATPEDAAQMLPSGPVVIVGNAAQTVAKLAGEHAEAMLPDLQPHARTLAVLGAGLTPVSPVRPLYLREPDVKPQADKTLARGSP